MKEKIVEILMCDLQGNDGGESIYCGTCIASESDEDRCDDCVRKSIGWGISEDYAKEIADRIIKEIG